MARKRKQCAGEEEVAKMNGRASSPGRIVVLAVVTVLAVLAVLALAEVQTWAQEPDTPEEEVGVEGEVGTTMDRQWVILKMEPESFKRVLCSHFQAIAGTNKGATMSFS